MSQNRFCCSTSLWEERSKANIREGWIGGSTDVVVSGRKGGRNILCDAKVCKDVVRIVQVWSIVNLEQRGISLRNPNVAIELSLKSVRICIDRPRVAWSNLVASVVQESHVELGGVVQIDIVEGQVTRGVG